MKAYTFRLGSVARVRALEERVARERFVLTLRDVRRAEVAAEAAVSALHAFEVPQGTMAAGEFLWIGDQAGRLSESVQACRQAVVDATSACAASRAAWNQAAKRSGVLERLDEQERARWRADMLRGEAAELDDLAMVRRGWSGAVL
jgi:flagellar export protein FliJ